MKTGTAVSAGTVKRIFDGIAAEGPVTRRELCRLTSLSKPSVCRGTELLEEAGAIVSVKGDARSPGRPADLLLPSPDVLLGALDLTGASPSLEVFDLNLRSLLRYRMRAPRLELYGERLKDFLSDKTTAVKSCFENSYFGAVAVLTDRAEDGELHAGPPLQGFSGDAVRAVVARQMNTRSVTATSYVAAALRRLMNDAGDTPGLTLCCHVGADEVFCALLKDGEPVRGDAGLRPILSARGTSLPRILSVCATPRELCREIARPLVNTLFITGADNLVIDADVYTFGSDLTRMMKKVLTEDFSVRSDRLPRIFARRHDRAEVLADAARDARDGYVRTLIERELRSAR